MAELLAGASGFSYPSWRPEFYPATARPADFLALYAERLPTVELNNTFYRLPAEAQFARWAAQTPENFRFAVKLPMSISLFGRLEQLGTFSERVEALGGRLGPVLVRLADGRPRDEGFLRLLLDSAEPGLSLALDARHPSWAETDPLLAEAGAVRVNALESDAPFRYLRLREPPYTDEDLARLVERVRPELERGVDVYCYFRHEEEPTAPRYAQRLLGLSARGTR